MTTARARARRRDRRESLRYYALNVADLALVAIAAIAVAGALGGAVWLWSVAMSR